MEIYKVVFKDKTSITVQAYCVTEAVAEVKYILESKVITHVTVDYVRSLAWVY